MESFTRGKGKNNKIQDDYTQGGKMNKSRILCHTSISQALYMQGEWGGENQYQKYKNVEVNKKTLNTTKITVKEKKQPEDEDNRAKK